MHAHTHTRTSLGLNCNGKTTNKCALRRINTLSWYMNVTDGESRGIMSPLCCTCHPGKSSLCAFWEEGQGKSSIVRPEPRQSLLITAPLSCTDWCLAATRGVKEKKALQPHLITSVLLGLARRGGAGRRCRAGWRQAAGFKRLSHNARDRLQVGAQSAFTRRCIHF